MRHHGELPRGLLVGATTAAFLLLVAVGEVDRFVDVLDDDGLWHGGDEQVVEEVAPAGRLLLKREREMWPPGRDEGDGER